MRALIALWIALLIAGLAALFLGHQVLPEQVASKFGDGGLARAFMTRNAYLWLMALLTVLIQLALMLGFFWLPRLFPRFANIPNKAYWLTSERRAQMQRILDRAGWMVAVAALAFIVATHWFILDANAVDPPRLRMAAFFGFLVLFLVTIASIAVWLSLRLRRRH